MFTLLDLESVLLTSQAKYPPSFLILDVPELPLTSDKLKISYYISFISETFNGAYSYPIPIDSIREYGIHELLLQLSFQQNDHVKLSRLISILTSSMYDMCGVYITSQNAYLYLTTKSWMGK